MSTQTTYRLSQRAGWAEVQPISELMSRALANPQLISLAAGFVDQQTLPVEPTRAALEELLADTEASRAALQYGTTPGFGPLREAILDRFLASDGPGRTGGLSLEQVVITAGSNQLLHLVVETLVDPGDLVLCAAPTYLVFLGTLHSVGARSLGIATDEWGMIPEALEARLAALSRDGELPRVKAIYLVSYFDNPCGINMPTARRAQIVEIAQRWSRHQRIHVIEDAAYRELHYDTADIASMRTMDEDGETVIVAGTFSKSFSPGIRVGFGILPPHLVEPLCNQKGNIDFGSPNFSQHLMAWVIRSGRYDPHVAAIRASYRQKLAAMLSAIRTHLGPLEGLHWITPAGGLYVWVTLPPHLKSGPGGALLEAAVQEGVLYVPGEYCFPAEGEPVQDNTLRLSFGVQSAEKIREGVAALARAIQRVMALGG